LPRRWFVPAADSLASIMTVGTPALWVSFTGVVVLLLVVDGAVLHRQPKDMSPGSALRWSLFWIGLALGFNAFIAIEFGRQKGLEFLTGYLIEESLSVDNLFVFLFLFHYFRVPKPLQRRVLFWGILGALVMRGLFIGVGSVLIHRFEWILYVFGGLLVYTGFGLLRGAQENIHPESNLGLKLFRRFMPTVSEFHGARFVVRQDGVRHATPLLVALVTVEFSDVLFAIDSIPAIFAVTTDPFIVYTSNICAVLGLRALYFLIAGAMDKFHYLHVGLGLTLGFIGCKMVLRDVFEITTGASLVVVAMLLGLAIVASIARPKRGQG
jgi:tellurite resistance protein TerC